MHGHWTWTTLIENELLINHVSLNQIYDGLNAGIRFYFYLRFCGGKMSTFFIN